jgi:DNA invertase Pin-like site-specific DNA recombinase
MTTTRTRTNTSVAAVGTVVRIALYVRISKDETGTMLGVERQEAMCRELIARRWGPAAVVTLYRDNNISAWSGAKRPAYNDLKAALLRGEYDVVVCYSADRLYRLVRQLEDIIDALEANGKGEDGVPVETVASGNVDLTTADGRMTARIMASVAQNSSDKTSERLKATNNQYAEKGWAPAGRPPYGFKRVALPGGGHTYAIVKSEAKVIKRIATALEAGDSLNKIARDLNHDLKFKRSGKPWTGQNVRHAIMSPAIAGQRGHTPRAKKGRVWRQVVVGNAIWPAIISKARWTKLEMILADESRRPRPASDLYWLTGVLVSEDGRLLVGSRTRGAKERKNTIDRRIYRTNSTGPFVSIDAEEVEGVIERLVLCLGDEFVGEEVPDVDTSAIDDELERIDTDLADLARRSGLADDDDDHLLPVERAAMRKPLMARRKVLLESRPVAEQSVLKPGVTLADQWFEMTPEQRRVAVVTYLGKIVVVAVGRRQVPTTDRLILPEPGDLS